MATKEEKQQLMDHLKFTPRTYKISMWGYGGEKVMGTVDPKVWDYCMEHSVDLQDIAWSDEDTVQDDMGLDLDQLPFYPGQWYECDNMTHVNGVSRDSGSLQIEDENGDTVFEKQLGDLDGEEGSPKWECFDEVYIGQRKKGEVVFVGSSNEKGTFFEGEIELRAPFDIEKLELHYEEVDGEEIVTAVYYDGEEIDNNGGSTDGKSSDMTMVRIIDDQGNWERYEPEEKDWGHPECGPSPDDWEKSPEFKFAKQQPVHVGWYRCCWKHFGTSLGTLYWNGTEFGDWEYGKFNPQSGVDTWQGYNWDTASWTNQPPEPPNTQCKKCKWVGSRDAMREDKDDYSYHCPECDSDNWDWIEYDPETAKGRKNRARYCVPAVPVDSVEDMEEALDELKREFEALMVAEEEPWIPAETAPTKKGVYECQLEKLPTWPWPNEAVLTWTGKVWKDENNKTVKPNAWRVLAEEDAV
jgi:hypothetical protein